MTVLVKKGTVKRPLSYVFPFGKYKGLSVAAVIRFNPGYLAWAVENIPGFDLDAEARRVGQDALNVHREQSKQRQNGWAWGFGEQAKSAAKRWSRRVVEIEFEERAKARAIAAAARQSGDVQQAPGEAPQSGHEVASPKGGSHA